MTRVIGRLPLLRHEDLPAIDPTIAERIVAYSRRRLFIQTCRWVALAVLVGLLALTVGLIIDGLIDSRNARFAASTIFYGTLFASLCCCAYWLFSKSQNLEQTAQELESRIPHLRQRLLSALEIAEVQHNGLQPGVISQQFCEKLQDQLADDMSYLDVRELLDWRRKRVPVVAATVGLIALTVASFVPGLYLPLRIQRVLAPNANLGRIAATRIELLSPTPGSKLIPLGDSVLIQVATYGPDNDVTLQTRSGGVSHERVMLSTPQQPTDGQHYSILLEAKEPRVDYQVSAGEARTQWFTLTTRPRPKAQSYTKHIRAPEYAGDPEVEEETDDGHISAVIGSQITLEVSPNIQNLAKAEIRWQSTTNPKSDSDLNIQTLVADSDTGKLSAEFSVSENAKYRVYLQDAETGFNNEYSPTWDIEAVDDLPPRVAWLRPEDDTITVRPNALVNLSIQVSDEFPVTSLIQQIRTNGGEWSATDTGSQLEALNANRLGKAKLDWQIDLMQYAAIGQSSPVNAGDVLELRLLCRDAAGNEAYSDTRKILVSSTRVETAASSLDMVREQTTMELFALSSKVHSIVSEMDEQSSSKSEVTDELLQSNFTDLSRLLEKDAMPLSSTTLALVGRVESTVIARELQLTGEILSEVVFHSTPYFRSLGMKPPSQWQEAIDSAKSFDRRLARFAVVYQTSVSFHNVKQHSVRIQDMASALEELSQSDSDARRVVREMDILVRQTKEVQQAMFDSLESLRPTSRDTVRQAAETLNQHFYNLERRRNTTSRESVIRLIEGMATSLRATGILARLDKSLPSAYGQALSWLQQNASPASEVIGQARARNLISDQETDTHLQLLQYRRSLARGRDERLLSSDLGYAKRAFEENSDSASNRKAYDQITRALSVLEAIHGLKRSQEFVAILLKIERWNFEGVSKNLESTSLWSGYLSELKASTARLKQLDAPQAVLDAFGSLMRREHVLRLSAKMDSRFSAAKNGGNATVELKRLEAELKSIVYQLKTVEERARNVLIDLSPSIESLARSAAKETQNLSAHSHDLATEVEQQRIPDIETSLEVLEGHKKLAQKPLEQLREALVDQADSKSLLDLDSVDDARRADMAIAMVDQAQALVGDSLETLNELQLAGSTDRQISDSLDQASQDQRVGSELLNQIASAYQSSSSTDATDSVDGNSDANRNALTSDEVDGQLAEEDYELAETLAEFGNQSLEEMLSDLEEELNQNQEMQIEISKISQEAIKQAIGGLQIAATDQHAAILLLEQTDTPTKTRKRLLLNSLKHFVNFEYPLINLLVNETRWAAGAARATDEERSLKKIVEELAACRAEFDNLSSSSTLNDLQMAMLELEGHLKEKRSELNDLHAKLESLIPTGVENNGAALNNRRREMKDRYRRVQQQLVRLRQQVVRNEKQRLKQAENDLTASLKRLKSHEGREEPSMISSKLERRHADALALLRDHLTSRADVATTALREANAQSSLSLDSSNPSAELAADLASKSQEELSSILEALPFAVVQPEPEATLGFVRSASKTESQVQDLAKIAANHLDRAARHEGRLKNLQLSTTLADFERKLQTIVDGSLQDVFDSLSRIQDIYANDVDQTQELKSQTKEFLSQGQRTEDEFLLVKGLLQKLITAQSTSKVKQETQPPTNSLLSALSAKQKAQMLDELDQMINNASEASLGKKEDDSQAPPSGTSGKDGESQKPGSLTEAAKQLASRLSQNREPLPSNATTDMGMATDSVMTNMDPQGPIQVQVLSANRNGNSDWGELRQQDLKTTDGKKYSNLSREYRVQVEAYFRALAERGLTDSKSTEFEAPDKATGASSINNPTGPSK